MVQGATPPLDDVWNLPINVINVVAKVWPSTTRSGEITNILEFGSGAGTALWREHGYRIFSIEHDEKFVKPSTDDVTYFHAPIVDRYYDKAVLYRAIEAAGDNAVWILDGPPSAISDRMACMHFVEKFKPKRVVVDDCHRQDGQDIVNALFGHRFPALLAHAGSLKGISHTSSIIEFD